MFLIGVSANKVKGGVKIKWIEDNKTQDLVYNNFNISVLINDLDEINKCYVAIDSISNRIIL